MSAAAPGRRVGDVLLAKGLLNEAQLARALEKQRHTGRRVGEILVEDGVITWFDLSTALAEQWDDVETAALPRLTPVEPRLTPVEPDPQADGPIEPTLEEMQEMLRDRQRRIIELSGTVTKLQRTVERLQDELRERDRRLVREAAS